MNSSSTGLSAQPLIKKAAENNVSEFTVNGMTIRLTPKIVRDYLVNGDKERVTMQELAMFINLCKYQGLNPWLREAYCIKYGSEPATLVTGRAAFEKRAERHPEHDGHQAGVIVMKPDGEFEYRVGAMVLDGEKVAGGWAEVWRKDQSKSTRVEVSFEEYAGRKKDGSLNQQWNKRPATMIRKVALVQALREAFPGSLGGMYAAEEQGAEDVEQTIAPVQEPEQQRALLKGPDVSQAEPSIQELMGEQVNLDEL